MYNFFEIFFPQNLFENWEKHVCIYFFKENTILIKYSVHLWAFYHSVDFVVQLTTLAPFPKSMIPSCTSCMWPRIYGNHESWSWQWWDLLRIWNHFFKNLIPILVKKKSQISLLRLNWDESITHLGNTIHQHKQHTLPCVWRFMTSNQVFKIVVQ